MHTCGLVFGSLISYNLFIWLGGNGSDTFFTTKKLFIFISIYSLIVTIWVVVYKKPNYDNT